MKRQIVFLLIFFYVGTAIKELKANDIKLSADILTISSIKKRADAYWKSIDGSVDYLSLSGGTLTGSLYGTSAIFSGSISAGPIYSTYMQGQQLYLLNGTGGAKVTITANNYGFAFEQPNDQPAIRLRRADGATNTLQSWDGVGNSTISGSLSASSVISTNYMQGQQIYLLNGTGGAKVTITANNYGFAFEQPSDQPAIHLRRADGATNTLQSWDGIGNSTVNGSLSATSVISTNYMQGQQLYLLNGTGGAKVTITANNYGFAFEQPSDQPAIHLRRADGATNTLQSWDGIGNSMITGNLGIGTVASSDRLTVSGNIRTKKIIVSQTGWPDYVFDSSYTLRPLSQVEKFIATNKRLPEMPSAKEVEEKGISVGDNQALLLKKIEEMTLYLIEQNKKLEQQQLIIQQQGKDIQQLKKKL